MARATLLEFVAAVAHGLHSTFLSMVRAHLAPANLAPLWVLLSVVLIKAYSPSSR